MNEKVEEPDEAEVIFSLCVKGISEKNLRNYHNGFLSVTCILFNEKPETIKSETINLSKSSTQIFELQFPKFENEPTKFGNDTSIGTIHVELIGISKELPNRTLDEIELKLTSLEYCQNFGFEKKIQMKDHTFLTFRVKFTNFPSILSTPEDYFGSSYKLFSPQYQFEPQLLIILSFLCGNELFSTIVSCSKHLRRLVQRRMSMDCLSLSKTRLYCVRKMSNFLEDFRIHKLKVNFYDHAEIFDVHWTQLRDRHMQVFTGTENFKHLRVLEICKKFFPKNTASSTNFTSATNVPHLTINSKMIIYIILRSNVEELIVHKKIVHDSDVRMSSKNEFFEKMERYFKRDGIPFKEGTKFTTLHCLDEVENMFFLFDVIHEFTSFRILSFDFSKFQIKDPNMRIKQQNLADSFQCLQFTLLKSYMTCEKYTNPLPTTRLIIEKLDKKDDHEMNEIHFLNDNYMLVCGKKRERIGDFREFNIKLRPLGYRISKYDMQYPDMLFIPKSEVQKEELDALFNNKQFMKINEENKDKIEKNFIHKCPVGVDKFAVTFTSKKIFATVIGRYGVSWKLFLKASERNSGENVFSLLVSLVQVKNNRALPFVNVTMNVAFDYVDPKDISKSMKVRRSRKSLLFLTCQGVFQNFFPVMDEFEINVNLDFVIEGLFHSNKSFIPLYDKHCSLSQLKKLDSVVINKKLCYFDKLYTGVRFLRSHFHMNGIVWIYQVTYYPKTNLFDVCIINDDISETVVKGRLQMKFNDIQKELYPCFCAHREYLGFSNLFLNDKKNISCHILFEVEKTFTRNEYVQFKMNKIRKTDEMIKNKQFTLNTWGKQCFTLHLNDYLNTHTSRFQCNGLGWKVSFLTNTGKFRRKSCYCAVDFMGNYIISLKYRLSIENSDFQICSCETFYTHSREWGFEEIVDFPEVQNKKIPFVFECIITNVYSKEDFVKKNSLLLSKTLNNLDNCRKGTCVFDIKLKNNNPIQTEEQVICGLPYFVEFFPVGMDDRKFVCVCLYLHCGHVGDLPKFMGKFTLSYVKQDGEKVEKSLVQSSVDEMMKFGKFTEVDEKRKDWKFTFTVEILL